MEILAIIVLFLVVWAIGAQKITGTIGKHAIAWIVVIGIGMLMLFAGCNPAEAHAVPIAEILVIFTVLTITIAMVVRALNRALRR